MREEWGVGMLVGACSDVSHRLWRGGLRYQLPALRESEGVKERVTGRGACGGGFGGRGAGKEAEVRGSEGGGRDGACSGVRHS